MDLGGFLRAGPCFLKIDVEGAEFQFLDTYQDELDDTIGMIVEWHTEFGEIDAAEQLLRSRGMRRRKRIAPGPNRVVDLYLR